MHRFRRLVLTSLLLLSLPARLSAKLRVHAESLVIVSDTVSSEVLETDSKQASDSSTSSALAERRKALCRYPHPGQQAIDPATGDLLKHWAAALPETGLAVEASQSVPQELGHNFRLRIGGIHTSIHKDQEAKPSQVLSNVWFPAQLGYYAQLHQSTAIVKLPGSNTVRITFPSSGDRFGDSFPRMLDLTLTEDGNFAQSMEYCDTRGGSPFNGTLVTVTFSGWNSSSIIPAELDVEREHQSSLHFALTLSK